MCLFLACPAFCTPYPLSFPQNFSKEAEKPPRPPLPPLPRGLPILLLGDRLRRKDVLCVCVSTCLCCLSPEGIRLRVPRARKNGRGRQEALVKAIEGQIRAHLGCPWPPSPMKDWFKEETGHSNFGASEV